MAAKARRWKGGGSMTERAERWTKEAQRRLAEADPSPVLTPKHGAVLCATLAELAGEAARDAVATASPAGGSPAWGNVKQCAARLGFSRDKMERILAELVPAGKVRVIGGNVVGGTRLLKQYSLQDLEAGLAYNGKEE